jgi:hypothetical protein
MMDEFGRWFILPGSVRGLPRSLDLALLALLGPLGKPAIQDVGSLATREALPVGNRKRAEPIDLFALKVDRQAPPGGGAVHRGQLLLIRLQQPGLPYRVLLYPFKRRDGKSALASERWGNFRPDRIGPIVGT